MLKRIKPIQYLKAIKTGRTEPLFIVCEMDNGSTVEVVAKFSAGCFENNINLAKEVIGACLAGDLGLPVPVPFLIEIDQDWINTIPKEQQKRVLTSSPVAFGSRVILPQFSIWNSRYIISDIMLPIAAAIFVFDGIIQNHDRRTNNPNCFVKGDEFRIFDHELAFCHDIPIIGGWKPPWELGGLNHMVTDEKHIFALGLKGRSINFDHIRSVWEHLSDEQILDYERSLPKEWPNVALWPAP